MAKLHDLGVAEAAKAIRTGDIKAEALADALLARAAAHKSLNAFITLEPDKVRAAAREADQQEGVGRLGRSAARRAAGAERQSRHHRIPDHRRYARSCRQQAQAQRGDRPGVARRRRHRARQMQSARARLRHHQQQRRLRPGAQSLRARSHSRGVERRYRRSGRRAACAGRHRVGHRRIRAHPGGPLRPCRSSPNHRPLVAGRHRADLAYPRYRGPDDPQRRRLCADRRRRDRRAVGGCVRFH